MSPLAPIPYALATLCIALLFAAVYRFGPRAAFRPGQPGRRRFLSLAAGISVGYVFVHVLPGLSEVRKWQTAGEGRLPGLFPEYSIYLWTMAGFLIFYGLEVMVARPRRAADGAARGGEDAPSQAWAHIGGFAAYTWLLTYLLVWSGKSPVALVLYAVAMGMHIFPIACTLGTEYGEVYAGRGATVLALASLAGWGCGLVLSVPHSLLALLVAVVAGGVIVNAMIAELPREKQGRYPAFLAGALGYAALLLLLSHFEKGG
jgi:hypothetical protein